MGSRRILLPAHQGLTVGGIGTVVRGIAGHLPEALGPDRELVVCPDPTAADGELDSLGAAGAFARLWREQMTLARLAARFDLVHLADCRPLLASRTPFLITVHDVFFLDHPEWLSYPARFYKSAMLRAAAAKQPVAVVCVSDYTRERLDAHLPRLSARAPVRVIYPGVDQRGGEWTPDRDRPYMLTVSTIEPRKNHLGLLRAFRRARRGGLKLRWLIAGQPGQLSRRIVDRLASEPAIELLGSVAPERLDRLYAGATLVATPSHVEGFGYPPLEAMTRGVPTVSAAAASLPEVVAEGGILVAPDDERAWAEALLGLAGDAEQQRRLSERGRVRSGQLSWRLAATKLAALYDEVL